MNRSLNVVRMQLVNKWTFIWVPLIILSATFAMTLLIFSLVPPGGVKYSGGIQAPLWYFMAMGIQAMSLTFPFSQALSITRREFYIGTMLTGLLAVGELTVIVAVMGFIEQATNGWGLNGSFFRVIVPLWEESPALAILAFFLVGMLIFTLGFLFATIYRRWGATVLTITAVAFGVVVVALVALLTKLELWGAVGSFFTTIGAWGGLGLLAVLVVLIGLGSYQPLRRAVG